MIRCKYDLLEALKRAGWSSYRIRKKAIFGEKTMQKFREGGIPSREELNKICKLLDIQPGDLLEYVPDDPPEE